MLWPLLAVSPHQRLLYLLSSLQGPGRECVWEAHPLTLDGKGFLLVPLRGIAGMLISASA